MPLPLADNPSFRLGLEPNDALSVMTRLRMSQAFDSAEPDALEGAVEDLLTRNLSCERPDWSEVTRKVMRGVVACICDQDEADWAIRRASQRAVLAVAKRWGNVVMAGKATVVATQEAASQAGFDSVKAAQQASLGALEGVRQVGPIAYPVLQQEISPIVSNFQQLLAEDRLRASQELEALVQEVEEDGPEINPRSILDELAPTLQPDPVPNAPVQRGWWRRLLDWLQRLFGL